MALRDKDRALKTTLESETIAQASASEALNQRARAEAGEAQARAAVDEFLTRVTEDQLLKAPGSQALRRELLRSALRFYDEFLKQRRDDPSLMAALAEVHVRVGSIYADLGEGRESRKAFQAARALFDKLAKANPEDRAILAGVANCQFRLGEYVPATALWEKLVAAEPTNPRYRRDLADAYNSLAIQQGIEKKLDEQLKLHQKALALREVLVHDDPDNLEFRVALGSTLNNLGVLLVDRGHPVNALAMYLREVEHEEAAFAKAPFEVLCARYLGVSYLNVARTQARLGRIQEAEHGTRNLSTTRSELPGIIRQCRPFELDSTSRMSGWRDCLSRRAGKPKRLRRSGRRRACWMRCRGGRRTIGITWHASRPAPPWEPATRRLSFPQKPKPSATADQRRIELACASFDGGSQTAEHIRTDPDLDILHGRADFQALVAQRKAAEIATSLAKRGESGSPVEKLKVQREVLEARAKLAKDQPRSVQHRADLAAAQYAVGQVLGDLDRFDEALKSLNEALTVRAALVQESPRRFATSSTSAGHAWRWEWSTGRPSSSRRPIENGKLALMRWRPPCTTNPKTVPDGTSWKGHGSTSRTSSFKSDFGTKRTNCWIVPSRESRPAWPTEMVIAGMFWRCSNCMPAIRRDTTRHVRNSSSISRTRIKSSTSIEPAGSDLTLLRTSKSLYRLSTRISNATPTTTGPTCTPR